MLRKINDNILWRSEHNFLGLFKKLETFYNLLFEYGAIALTNKPTQIACNYV